jgi:triacylglycerol lipase
MTIPLSKRLYRRARRSLAHRWSNLSVTVTGNRITRRTNFGEPVPHPILLLQGFGSTRRGLLLLEQRLRADGYVVFSIRLGGLFGTLNTKAIDQLARLVGAKIASLRARFGLGRITIIGHSKGGLIGRYWVSCLGGDVHCDRLITLGTPHAGLPRRHLAKVSPFGFAMPSLRQMQPDSTLFQDLRLHVVPTTVACISIASSADRVAPPALCHWMQSQGATPLNITLHGYDHSDYLIKAGVYEAIAGVLGPLDTSASTC